MSYLVLARKYRSQNFSELVGQDHVVRALTNALQTQRLHHAYLFTGTRGVGKTTISRILAKSLNCLGADGQGGITAEPCGVCQACRDIDAGRFVDYIELDAASNRGVDEISQLLEQSVYKPVVGRFKVFMIDEVHMLSNTAFNAMLKTLEEPPEYLKFVLATTDPQKVPVTVLSRCLQFNLRPIAPESIAEHLQQVLTAEQIGFDAGSLRLLAKAAHGSMRDALSLSDQAIAYSHGEIEENAVRQMLGSVDLAHVYKLIEALAQGDAKAVVEMVDFMRVQGLSAAAALEEMTSVLQRMAIVKAVPDALQANDPDDAAVAALVPLMASDEIQLLYSIALHGLSELGLASDEYAALVMVLLRVMAFRGPAVEQGAQAIAVKRMPQGAGVSPMPEKKTERRAPCASVQKTPPPVISPAKPSVAREPERLPPAQPAAVESGAQSDDDDLPPWVDDVIPDEGMAASSVQKQIRPAQKTHPAVGQAVAANVQENVALAVEPEIPQMAVALPQATPASERWEQVVMALIEQDVLKALVRELALNAQVESISEGEQRWVLKCARKTLMSEANQQKLVALLQAYLGHAAEVSLEHGDVIDTPGLRAQAALAQRQAQAQAHVAADPDVQKWLREFPGARIVPGSVKPV